MRRFGQLAALLTLTATAAVAHADRTEDLGRRVGLLEGQAVDLERGLGAPATVQDQDAAERHLIQAQVAIGVGNYDDASILLYDVVEKYPSSKAYPDAVFFLAEALYQRGDIYTSRDFFNKTIDDFGSTGTHYIDALERCIELSIRIKDDSRITDYLQRLEQLPPTRQTESIPYVRGKYAFFHGDYDEALKQFALIRKESQYLFQGRYFAGVTYVAKGDLDSAALVLLDLLKLAPQKPKPKAGETEADAPEDDNTAAKVLELAHLALGRIDYERDMPSEAIDQYLAISRHSANFDAALYEVAWVYVKAKEFDKALRALELLSLANPKSAMLPEVRILEGNLRIRKANTSLETNSVEELAKAENLFDSTRLAFDKPKQEIDAAIAGHADPRVYFTGLTGRAGNLLDIQVALGDVASEWVKQEPEVGRMVAVTKTLDDIDQDLADSDRVLNRVEHAVNSPTRVMIFPQLFDKRARSLAIGDEVFGLRQALVLRERELVIGHADAATRAALDELDARRKALVAQLAAIPGSANSFEERLGQARRDYINLDKRAQEVEVNIYSIEAQLAALEKYYHDDPARKMPATQFNDQLRDLRAAVAALRKELDNIRADGELDADQAGIGDDAARAENDLRAQVTGATRDEHQALQHSGGSDPDLITAGRFVDECDAVDAVLGRANGRIDKLVDVGLADVRVVISEQKAHISEYRQTLTAYNGEDMGLGGEVMAGSFETVSKKFYEIGIRANVGLLDVSWAEKEQAGQGAERLRLDYAHEKNQLDADFRDVREPEKDPNAKP